MATAPSLSSSAPVLRQSTNRSHLLPGDTFLDKASIDAAIKSANLKSITESECTNTPFCTTYSAPAKGQWVIWRCKWHKELPTCPVIIHAYGTAEGYWELLTVELGHDHPPVEEIGEPKRKSQSNSTLPAPEMNYDAIKLDGAVTASSRSLPMQPDAANVEKGKDDRLFDNKISAGGSNFAKLPPVPIYVRSASISSISSISSAAPLQKKRKVRDISPDQLQFTENFDKNLENPSSDAGKAVTTTQGRQPSRSGETSKSIVCINPPASSFLLQTRDTGSLPLANDLRDEAKIHDPAVAAFLNRLGVPSIAALGELTPDMWEDFLQQPEVVVQMAELKAFSKCGCFTSRNMPVH